MQCTDQHYAAFWQLPECKSLFDSLMKGLISSQEYGEHIMELAARFKVY